MYPLYTCLSTTLYPLGTCLSVQLNIHKYLLRTVARLKSSCTNEILSNIKCILNNHTLVKEMHINSLNYKHLMDLNTSFKCIIIIKTLNARIRNNSKILFISIIHWVHLCLFMKNNITNTVQPEFYNQIY